jgi:lipopolysaccharide biosynthesis glycosyltransferase
LLHLFRCLINGFVEKPHRRKAEGPSASSPSFLFADYQQNCAQDVQQIHSLCKQESVQVTLLPFERIKDFCNQRNFPSYHGYLLNYACLFLPELLPDVHKIIYLDSDTLVLKPIDQLWTESLNGMPMGVVHSYDASFGNGSALEKRDV